MGREIYDIRARRSDLLCVLDSMVRLIPCVILPREHELIMDPKCLSY